MLPDRRSHLLAALATGITTVAVFAKSFTPYYLVGSTAIFVIACLIGLVLISLNWRQILDLASHVRPALVLIVLLYGVVTASYLVNSFPQVPVTHLWGLLIFHGMFLLFGFASARAPAAVFAILLIQGIAYVAIFGQYAIRFGDFVQNGFLEDVFGIGHDMAIATHQQVGSQMALAALAAFALASGRMWPLSLGFMALATLFIYRLQARTTMVAFGGAFAFLAFGAFYARSKSLALLTASAVVVSTVLASALFFQYALRAKVEPDPPDLISRTIVEIQQRPSGMRLAIWSRTWDRIASSPDKLLLGRGVGVFPIDEGVGPPDWLLRKAEGSKYYPHNIHLEMLYETGILGLLAYSILSLLPLVAAIKYWTRLSVQEKSAFSMYFFYCVSMEFSGAFAFSYDFQFFLGMAIGIVALKRKEVVTLSSTFEAVPAAIGASSRST
jgi:O-antigen ligase